MFLDLQAFEKLLVAKEPTRALRMAILANNFPAAQRAVDAGANVNIEAEISPLRIAIELNSKDIVNLLIENGAKVNVKSKDGFSPLCIAVANNYLDTAKALLDAGAAVNYKICHGGTALFFCKTIKMLKLLIEYGIDINVKNDYGYIVTETTPYKKIAKYVNSLYKNNAEKTNNKGDK